METTEQVETVFFPPRGGPRVLSKKTDVIPDNAYFVSKTAKGGNRYKLDIDGDRETVIRNCIADFPNRSDLMEFLDDIRGRDLVCYGAPEFCHAHAYIFAANPELQQPKYWRADVYEIIKPLGQLDDLDSNIEQESASQDHQPLTVTPGMLDELAAYGVQSFSDEIDDRLLPTEEQCVEGVAKAMEALISCVAETRLERYADEMLWAFVNIFHNRQKRIDREIDEHERKRLQLERQQLEGRRLESSDDGSEVISLELEYETQLALTLEETQNVFIVLRDLAAQVYRKETGSPWRPASGSRLSANGMTSSVIDSMEAREARRKARAERLNPTGPVIYVGGSTEFQNWEQVWTVLDERLKRNPSLFMRLGDTGKGAELFAMRWAEARGVDYELIRPNWKKYNKAAPFMRNTDALKRALVGVVAFQNRDDGGSVVIRDLIKKAKLGRKPLIECLEETPE